MYYKNIIKNRERLLKNDLLIKDTQILISQLKKIGELKKININTNIDFKSFKRVLQSGNENSQSSHIQVFSAYFSLLKMGGQTPKLIKTKKSVANWNIREGMVTGVKLTLRKENLNRFYKKYLLCVLPTKIESFSKNKNKNTLNKKYLNNNWTINTFSQNELLSLLPLSNNNNGYLWTINEVEDNKKNKKSTNLFNKLINHNINNIDFNYFLSALSSADKKHYYLENKDNIITAFSKPQIYSFISDNFYSYLKSSPAEGRHLGCNINFYFSNSSHLSRSSIRPDINIDLNKKFRNSFISSYFLLSSH